MKTPIQTMAMTASKRPMECPSRSINLRNFFIAIFQLAAGTIPGGPGHAVNP
jgi:hypothetical protein